MSGTAADIEVGAVVGPPVYGSDEFESAMDSVTGYLNAQHARLVELTVALLADEQEWVERGIHTPELFLAWRAGLSAQHARQVVAIARRVSELPVSVAAFGRGELSLDQMAAIAHRCPWWADAEVCDLARYLTVAQIRNLLGKYPFPDIPHPDSVTDGDADASAEGAIDATTSDATTSDEAAAPDGDGSSGVGDTTTVVGTDGVAGDGVSAGAGGDAAAPVESRVWWGVGDDGVFRLHAECDQVSGMIIDAALSEARDALFHDGNHNVDDIDALVEIAQRSLDHVGDSTRRDRFRTNIHVHTDRPATDACGHALPDAVRQYVTCDGVLSPVFYTDGSPVSVGRSQRIVPARTRRLVTLRDQGCRVPGCNRRRHLDVHHIVHWEHGGTTNTANLICLCPQHHRMHHQGHLGIVGDADAVGGMIFTNHRGDLITASGARPQPPTGPPPPPESDYQHPLGERLDTSLVIFNPPHEHRHRLARITDPIEPNRAN